MSITTTLVRRAVSMPAIRNGLAALYEYRFASAAPVSGNWYRGVFASFADAQASAPRTRPLGYDNTSAAALYRERTRRVYISDYPTMFWLKSMFDAGCESVFDIGGHVGIAYYAYQRYVKFPKTIRWRVLDVPAVVAAGRAFAIENDPRRRLEFTENPVEADGSDIVLASGSLQYLPYRLADLLGSLARPPKHLLLNLVPIHMTKSYFTLQNMGAAYCAYRITAEREFIDGLKVTGYALRDRWENPDRQCLIPFHPDYSLDRYFGFCFNLEKFG